MAAELGEKEAGEEAIEETEKARVDEDEDEFSTGKRGKHSKKHRHKHSKKHKHKHKKRKHKKRSLSRSRSKSSSRSRSKSPDSSSGENDKPGEPDNRVASSEKNGTINQEAENKTTDLEDTEDLPFGWFPEAEDSPSEDIAPVEPEDASFKLTKSPPVSSSPSSTPVDETELVKGETKAPDAPKTENKINLGFPLKIGASAKSRSKSPDVPGKTMESKISNVPSPESKIKEKSQSPSDSKIKKRSRSPSDPKRSKSPMESKIKKSRSRSKSRSRKSRSKSPRKKSRSSSTSSSRSPHKHQGRSRSRSSSYSRKKSRKRERSRSRSRKSRSRSPTKRSRKPYYKTRSRSRSPPYRDRKNKRDDTSYDRKGEYLRRSRRSRSHDNKYSRRSRSVSPSRSHRRRSHSRSPRRGRSRSPRRDKYKRRSRSRSRSERYRRRSRSRSYSSRRRSRSRSRSRSRDRRHRRSRSKSKDKNNREENKGVKSEDHTSIPGMNNNKPSAQDLVGKAPAISDPTNKRSLAELTEFCKKLTEARGIEAEGKAVEEQKGDEEEDNTEVEISHPFLVAPKKDITIPPVLLPPLRLPPPPLVASDKPLTEQFPVSCGTKHHEKEHDVDNVGQVVPHVDGSVQQVQHVFMQPQNQEKLDISGLVVKRMEAQRRLQANPNDVDAMLSLQEVEMKLNSWCQSNVKPGQFTGQLAKSMMPKEKMNSGYQAWARKDMFHNLNPVSGGIGMKLLQKMGWEPGQVLGKRGQGMVEPIALTVKVDRKGLSSNTEKPVGKKGGGNKPIVDLQGKHPISTLQEYSARRKWQVPEFTLIFDEGPPHSKQFLFKVAVNGYEYQHPVVSSNKKHAKAQAAVAALKGLGLVPEDTVY